MRATTPKKKVFTEDEPYGTPLAVIGTDVSLVQQAIEQLGYEISRADQLGEKLAAKLEPVLGARHAIADSCPLKKPEPLDVCSVAASIFEMRDRLGRSNGRVESLLGDLQV